MPTTRTRRARSWQSELDRFRREALLDGPTNVLIAGAGYHNASCISFPSLSDGDWQTGLDEMRRDWLVHRADLLAAWKAEYGPDARPWAWWQFDATDAQRAAAGKKLETQHD